MTDTRREFNLIFCPNDPNPKVKELVRLMAFYGQEWFNGILWSDSYASCDRAIFVWCKCRTIEADRKQGAQKRYEKVMTQPDLMRHYVFMDVRASDVAFSNTIKYYQRIPVEYIRVITKYCDTCRKHFMQTVRDQHLPK